MVDNPIILAWWQNMIIFCLVVGGIIMFIFAVAWNGYGDEEENEKEILDEEDEF